MTDPSLTLAGAAIPKAPQELKPRSRSGWRKVECFDCGASYGMSRAQIRLGLHPCRCGAGLMVPSDLDDCAELAPEQLPRHPLAALEQERQERRAIRENRSQGHVHQCRACSKLIAHPRAECSCGFDNGAGAYREGSSYTPTARATVTVPPLAHLQPSTRAERAQYQRDRAAGADLPF